MIEQERNTSVLDKGMCDTHPLKPHGSCKDKAGNENLKTRSVGVNAHNRKKEKTDWKAASNVSG